MHFGKGNTRANRCILFSYSASFGSIPFGKLGKTNRLIEATSQSPVGSPTPSPTPSPGILSITLYRPACLSVASIRIQNNRFSLVHSSPFSFFLISIEDKSKSKLYPYKPFYRTIPNKNVKHFYDPYLRTANKFANQQRSFSDIPVNNIPDDYKFDNSNDLFYNIIPNTYVYGKGKAISVHFDIRDIGSQILSNEIIAKVPRGFTYTVFIKVKYNINEYFMAGNQFGFVYLSEVDINNLDSIVYQRLDEYLDLYNITEDDIRYVMLSFKQKDKKLLSEFSLSEKPHISKSEFIITERKLNVPVSINEDYLGKPLPVNVSNGIITNIYININDKRVNFLDLIRHKAKVLRPNHKDNITVFDENFKFYLLKDKGDFVLAIKKLKSNSIDKIRYSLSGVVISHVTDNAVNNLILRSSGERLITIDNGKIVNTRQNIKLKPLEVPSYKPLFVENRNIGVIDIETYRAIDNTFKVYALGFKTNLAEKSKIYYLDKTDLDSDKIVLSLVDELLRPKYENITFYCHNLGGYDIVFILNILYKFNDKINYVRNEK